MGILRAAALIATAIAMAGRVNREAGFHSIRSLYRPR
jgi:hypothetical protein